MQKWVIGFAFLALVTCDVSHLFKSKYKTKHQKYFGRDSEGFVPQLQQYPNYRLPDYDDYAIPIINQEQNIGPSGSYEWRFETANGIAAEEIAVINDKGSNQALKSVRGSYQYTSPDGVPVLVTYTADENGFQPHVITNGGPAYDVLPDFYKMPINK